MFRSRPARSRASANQGAVSAADTPYAQGVAAFARGDLETGRRILLQSLQSGPVTLDYVLDVAEQLDSVGFTAEADQLLRRAVDLFAHRPQAKAALAEFLAAHGKESDAVLIALEGLQAHPNNLELHAVAARAHEMLGALPEASHHLGAILAIDADDLEANQRLAPILERLGDRAGFIRCLRRAVSLTGGEDPDAVTALGIALSQDGQHGEAVDLLSEVARRRPHVSAVRADLAMAQLAAGDVREALAGFTEALRLDDQSAQAYCGMGLCYQQLHRWHDAAEAFRRTEALAPALTAGPFNLGLALSELGDREGGMTALLRAAALAPEDPEIREAMESLQMEPAAPPGPQDSPNLPARFTGDLKTFQLADVLEFLRVQNQTGTLVLSSGHGLGVIRLVRGQLTSASAPGMRLAETLLRDRVLSADQLRRAVFQQLLDVLGKLSIWRDGGFSFHPAPSPDLPLPAIHFNPQAVMLELTRLADERKKAALPSQEDQ